MRRLDFMGTAQVSSGRRPVTGSLRSFLRHRTADQELEELQFHLDQMQEFAVSRPGQRPVRMRRVELWFEAQGRPSVRNHEIEFVPGRDCKCEDGDEECCERYFLTCVASEDWPCLFHGLLEYPFPFVHDDRQVTIGNFLFPECVGVVHRAYIVCSYEAGPAERCLPRPPVCESDCDVACGTAHGAAAWRPDDGKQ